MNLLAPASVVLALTVLVGCGTDPQVPDTVATDSSRGGPLATADRAPAPHPPRLTSADGTTSPFDLEDPGIANLDPDLLHAVQAAATDASADGVRFWVTSGWRSRAKQESLLADAIQRYGTVDEALRYVSTPDKSAHVTGHAVDIGPAEADRWLSEHGAAYGLCQSFANEIWHFELATEPGGTCPAPIPDSSYR